MKQLLCELEAGRSSGELVVNKQIVFYEVADDRIEVLRSIDGRTDYLSKLF